MRLNRLKLKEGESIFIVLEDENGQLVHALIVFALDGRLRTSNK